MPTLTVSIPKELKEEMDKRPQINWPEVIKAGLEKKGRALLKFKEMYEKGEL